MYSNSIATVVLLVVSQGLTSLLWHKDSWQVIFSTQLSMRSVYCKVYCQTYSALCQLNRSNTAPKWLLVILIFITAQLDIKRDKMGNYSSRCQWCSVIFFDGSGHHIVCKNIALLNNYCCQPLIFIRNYRNWPVTCWSSSLNVLHSSSLLFNSRYYLFLNCFDLFQNSIP